jgi:methyltransferase (TIGR00027 family)
MPTLQPLTTPPVFRANMFALIDKGEKDTVYDNEEDLDAGVGQTARWAAAMRAAEHKHPRALLKDPLARIFAGESAMKKVGASLEDYMKKSSPNSHSHIAIRARAFDDIIEEELGVNESAELEQVVNLGAGMCTRAWRLHFPSQISWYEVDRPESIRLREKLVRSVGIPPQVDDFYMIPVDLSLSMDNMLTNVLKKRSFDTKAPTIVVMEGLLMYLSIPDIQKLANELNELISGSACIVASCINDAFLHDLQNPGEEREKAYPATGQVKELFVSSWESGTRQAFENAGWSVDLVVPREKFAENFLDCEMIHYPFPDRSTCTEYIIVMRRPRKESFAIFLEDILQFMACRSER